MESEKDTNQKDIVKKGQDSFGIDLPMNIPDNENQINKVSYLFSGEVQTISLRSEKLIAATYLVASLMPDNEPLKGKLQEAALCLISDIRVLKGHSGREGLRNLIDSIDLIISFLYVASAANLISAMNYSILKNEYGKLREFIKSLKWESAVMSGADVVLGEEFFSIPTRESPLTIKSEHGAGSVPGNKVPANQEVSYKGHFIKDKDSEIMSFTDKRVSKGHGAYYKPQRNNAAEIKSNRKNQILKIIRKRKTVTIKDLFGEISGCSEKTIQRELSTLVSGGVLKKEGEKRWSRYSLVQ